MCSGQDYITVTRKWKWKTCNNTTLPYYTTPDNSWKKDRRLCWRYHMSFSIGYKKVLDLWFLFEIPAAVSVHGDLTLAKRNVSMNPWTAWWGVSSHQSSRYKCFKIGISPWGIGIGLLILLKDVFRSLQGNNTGCLWKKLNNLCPSNLVSECDSPKTVWTAWAGPWDTRYSPWSKSWVTPLWTLWMCHVIHPMKPSVLLFFSTQKSILLC